MNNLKAKLEKALAFDDEMASRAAINGRPIIINHETLKFREAASWENARLAPLHTALIEAVEALERSKQVLDEIIRERYSDENVMSGMVGNDPAYIELRKQKEVLAKLDKVLEDK